MPLRAGVPTCAGSQPSASPAARRILAGLLQSPSSLGPTSSVPQCAGRPPQRDRSQKWEEEVGCCGVSRVISSIGKAARSMVPFARPEPLPCHCGLEQSVPSQGHSTPRPQPASILPHGEWRSGSRQQETLFEVPWLGAGPLHPSCLVCFSRTHPSQRNFVAPSFPHASVYSSTGSTG